MSIDIKDRLLIFKQNECDFNALQIILSLNTTRKSFCFIEILYNETKEKKLNVFD